MAPIPRSEQQVEKLIGHIGALTEAIHVLMARMDDAASQGDVVLLDIRMNVLTGKLEAAEKRLDKLERKPL